MIKKFAGSLSYVVIAVVALGFVGCASHPKTQNPVEASVSHDAEAPAAEEGEVSAASEAERIAAVIAEWLEPYQKTIGMKTVREGDDLYLHCTFGALPSIFSTYDITVAVYAEKREVSFIGFLPTIVPAERRSDMVEFIFRGEWEYGLSTASMILEDDGHLRCQAWLPFESIERQPREAKWRLMGAVLDKLWSFSEGVASVALGGEPIEAAENITRIAAFEGSDEASELSALAEVDTKTVLERCFDEDAGIIKEDSGDKWLKRLSGEGGDVRVGIINARFEEVVRDMGGRYDVLPYSLIVREGIVWNVCCVPDECPAAAVGDVADVLMKLNQALKYALFGIDFKTGRMWCHYSLPVSAIPDASERPQRNLYGALIKTLPVQGVAHNSELLHSAVADAQEAAQEGEASAVPIAQESEAPVPLMTKVLNAYDAWESARWDLSNTNSLEVATRERIAARKYMKYCDDGIDEEAGRRAWPFDVDAFEGDLAQKMVRDSCGLYCVKGDFNDYDEGVMDDGNVAINPSIRWLYRKTEEWATNALDAAYRRLGQDEMLKMLGTECINEGTFCWAVGTNEYFVIQRVEEDLTFEARDYIYMKWDGEGEARILASFNSFPSAKTMSYVRACMAGVPAGKNNMAALIWNNVKDKGESELRTIQLFLFIAKEEGVAEADENLDLLVGEFGCDDLEEDVDGDE